MLKIKDNIDLKELEKFGFKGIGCNYICNLIGSYPDDFIEIQINKQDRELILCINTDYSIVDTELAVLYDLIQAGLVEKVE